MARWDVNLNSAIPQGYSWDGPNLLCVWGAIRGAVAARCSGGGGVIENTDTIIAPLCSAMVARKARIFINAQVLKVVKNQSSLSMHHTDVFLAYIFG